MAKKRPAQQDVMVLSDLEQIKVLADPLRVRILEAFVVEEQTTKQVAERIGEKPTKLYHHVEALERVGLIRMIRTRQNRGTIEKYYEAVARRFEADSQLFSQQAGPDRDASLGNMAFQLLQRTGDELRQLVKSENAAAIEDEGALAFFEIHADEKAITRIRRRIERLAKDIAKLDDPDAPSESARRYRLTLAYYPLDRS